MSSIFQNRTQPCKRRVFPFLFICLILLVPALGVHAAASEPNEQDFLSEKQALQEQKGGQRSLLVDIRDIFVRVPGVYKNQLFSRDGLRIFAYGAPALGLSTIKERDISDFFRKNRIKKRRAGDVALDHSAARFYPLIALPVYTLARTIEDDHLADLSVDLLTFSLSLFPEIFAIRYIGDRPRPDGSKGFSLGLDSPSSFPSGHVAMAVGTARLADYHCGHWIGVPLYLVAAGIAYQRLGAEEHYLADIIGGAILSYSLADALVRLRKKKMKQQSTAGDLTILPLTGGSKRFVGLSFHWTF